jgi:hypothetical protein
VGKPEGKRAIGKPRHRSEDNIKIDLQEVGWEHGPDCAGSKQEQAMGSCEFGNELLDSIE